MCHNCNQINDCNCNNTVPCQKCDTPSCNNVCRFTGENIDGVGIVKNEDISTAIEKIAEYSLNISASTQTIVKLSYIDNAAITLSETLTPTNSSVLSGMSYTVPLNSGSEHDIYVEGQATFINDSEMVIGVYVNNTLKGYLRSIKSKQNTIIPFSISASDLMLVPGDILNVRAVRIDTGVEVYNCMVKVIKR
jgi:hypothetical protein